MSDKPVYSVDFYEHFINLYVSPAGDGYEWEVVHSYEYFRDVPRYGDWARTQEEARAAGLQKILELMEVFYTELDIIRLSLVDALAETEAAT